MTIFCRGIRGEGTCTSLQQRPVTAAVVFGVVMQAVLERLKSILLELFSEGRPAYSFLRNLVSGVLM